MLDKIHEKYGKLLAEKEGTNEDCTEILQEYIDTIEHYGATPLIDEGVYKVEGTIKMPRKLRSDK
jgi:hypothetical protein